MSTVNIAISMALQAVAAGLTTARVKVTITDSNGNSAVNEVAASDFPTPDADGKFTVNTSFSDVLDGSISGSVQAVSSSGANVGVSVSFSGQAGSTGDNMQPVPITVNLS